MCIGVFGINGNPTRSLEWMGVFLIKILIDTHWDMCEIPWRRSLAATSDSSINASMWVKNTSSLFPGLPGLRWRKSVTNPLAPRNIARILWTVFGWLAVDESRTLPDKSFLAMLVGCLQCFWFYSWYHSFGRVYGTPTKFIVVFEWYDLLLLISH